MRLMETGLMTDRREESWLTLFGFQRNIANGAAGRAAAWQSAQLGAQRLSAEKKKSSDQGQQEARA